MVARGAGREGGPLSDSGPGDGRAAIPVARGALGI